MASAATGATPSTTSRDAVDRAPPRRLGGGAAPKRADAGAAAEGRARRLLDQRGDAAGGRARARRRARSPSGSATALERAARRRPRARRGRRPGLPQPVPRRRLVHGARAAAALAAGDDYGAGASEAPERVNLSSSSSANPTGPLTSRPAAATPPTATRSRASLELAGHEVDREYYFNDAGGQVQRSARRSRRARAARSRPRTATRASTSPSSRAQIDGRGRRRRRRAGASAASSCMLGGDRGDAGRASGVDFDRFFSRARAAGRAGRRSTRAIERLREHGHVYEHEGALWLRTHRLRRRQGPRARALERRARPTSPPTSPTTRTSASAATTADRRAGRRPPRLHRRG